MEYAYWTLNSSARICGSSGGLSFSPNGRLLAVSPYGATSGYRERVPRSIFWDVSSLRIRFELNDCASFQFTSDGRFIIGDLQRLFSAADGRLVRRLDPSIIAVSPDGNTAVSFDDRQTFKVSDLKTNRVIDRFTSAYKGVSNIVFSNDGRLILIVGYRADNNQEAEIRDTSTSLQVSIAADRHFVSFTPDGLRLLLAHETKDPKSEDGTVVFESWDARNGKFLKQLGPPQEARIVNSFQGFEMTAGGAVAAPPVFSSDGSLLAWSEAESLRLLSGNGSARFYFSGSQDRANALAFSPDNQRFAVMKGPFIGEGAQRYELWESQSGTSDRVYRATSVDDRPEVEMGFSANGRYLRTGSGGSLNLETMQEVALERDDNELRQLLNRLKISEPPMRVALSQDEKLLAVSFDFFTLKENQSPLTIYDVQAGREVANPPSVEDQVQQVVFSRDAQLVAVTSGSGNAGFVSNQVFDQHTGRELTDFFNKDEEEAEMSNKSVFLTFSPDSRLAVLQGRCSHDPQYCASGAIDSSTESSTPVTSLVELRDARDGKLLKTLRSGSALAVSAAYTADGKILAVGCDDSSVKLWSADSGELLATLFSFEDNTWFVVTPDGLFDGLPLSWNKIIWRFNNNTFNYAPVEAFYNEFYHPGLLAELMAGQRPEAPSDISRKDRRQPQLKLTASNAQSGQAVADRNVTVKIDISEVAAGNANQTGSGAQDVRLFRNGSLVKAWRGDVLQGKSTTILEATVPIIAGENKLTAYAFNRDNIKSSDATFTVIGADSLRRTGTAYILAVGINNYSNPEYNLKYAVADADDFAAEVKRQQESLKRYARVEVISLADAQATKANIIEKLAHLAKLVQPEDAVIIYFAGHGTAHGKQFYLIPHDLGYDGPRESLSEAGLQKILAHSVSDRELEQLFEGLDAGQLLLVIDACNSGQALEAEEKRRGPMNSKGLAQLAYEKGMYVLTAAQSYQAAQEAARFGHGFLTYALVEDGLKKGAADREPKDRSIDLREWLNFATEQVPKMQEKNSLEALRSRNRYVIFVGDGQQRKGQRGLGVKDNVQRPRIFYRRETDANPLIIAVLGSASP